MSVNEFENKALESQAEVPENLKIAAELAEKNPDRAREILKERLAKMSPEQIAALRAAKAKKMAKIETEKEQTIVIEEVVDPVVAPVIEEPAAEILVAEAAVAEVPVEEAIVEEAIVEEAVVEESIVEEIVTEQVPVTKPAPKKRRRRRGISYESRQAFTGFMFVLPWFLGFLLFFAIPCFQSLRFSFSSVAALDGYKCTWIGLDNYVELLTRDPNFFQNLLDTLLDLAVNVPVILIFSLFVAVLLNRKFIGRGLVRAIFFLPVIVTTGVVMSTFQGGAAGNDAAAVMEGSVNNGVMFETANASEFLTELGMNEQITEYMSMIADRIFSVVWDSGIQILLFLAALQSISPSLYEASNVEGATAWETFWLITFPNVAPIILVNIVYTIVDTFSDTENKVLMQIDTYINGSLKLGMAAAASWTFFIVVLLIIGVVFLIFRMLGGKND